MGRHGRCRGGAGRADRDVAQRDAGRGERVGRRELCASGLDDHPRRPARARALMLSRWLGRQLRQPSGLGGWLIARIMNRSNAAMNQRAIELLDVQPTHAVLEVGFGGGLALAPLLARARSGRVTGVDPSDDMLAAAAEHHRAAIASGRLRLERAGVEALPHGDREFDRVLSVNTLYFWPDPARGFAEIRRVLRPGGKLVLGYRP